MKKQLKIIIPIIFIGVFAYFGFQIYSKIQHKKQVAEYIKTMPKFEYQNTKGGVFTQNNLKNSLPTLFIYFNSDCEFCNEEATMVQQNIAMFQDIQVVFVSFETSSKIMSFAKQHKLYTYDNIYFVADTQLTFATTFDVKSLRCLVL